MLKQSNNLFYTVCTKYMEVKTVQGGQTKKVTILRKYMHEFLFFPLPAS